MTALVPFDYSGRQVRTVTVDGEPWFVAADVCAVLDLGNPRSSLALLEEDERGVHTVDTPGGPQQVTVVNEPGLYSLILRSRKPEAKAFKRWLTHEVIPAIRKTGSYGGGLPALPDMSTPEGQLQALDAWRATVVQNIEQQAQIKALQPKADYVDGFVGATTDATLLRVLANQLGIKEQALRDLLVQQKVIYRKLEGTRYSRSRGRQVPEYSWHAYADYSSWFVEKDQPEAPRLHNGQMRTTLYVTPVGKVKVADLITKAGAA
jgi:anti-repressor protein